MGNNIHVNNNMAPVFKDPLPTDINMEMFEISWQGLSITIEMKIWHNIADVWFSLRNYNDMHVIVTNKLEKPDIHGHTPAPLAYSLLNGWLD